MAVVSKMRATTKRISQQGFTLLQMIIVVALICVVTTFSAIGIVNARAHIRLARSARQFASLAEKARGDSVRRHGAGGTMANLILLSTTSYSVTMDFDNNGVVDGYDTQTFNLEEGITFATGFVGTTITFDWRGRSVTGQVAPTMILYAGSASSATTLITISGSGDITLDSESFPDGSIPDVVLSGTPGGDIRPDPPPNPTPGSGSSSPTPTPSGTPDPNSTPTPYPTATPVPTPTPCNNHGVNCRDDDPTPTPTPQASPGATPNASPTPSAGQCTLSASPNSLTLANRATVSLTLNVQNSSGATTVSVSNNSNSSHISVTLAPGQTGIVTGSSGTVTYNVVMNGANQQGTISFNASSPCSASASVGVNQ